MTWILVGVAVCGWTVAAGLYLQLKDALGLARSWRETAIVEGKRAQANLNLAEFAVRQLPPPPYGKTYGTVNETARLRVVD